MKKTDASIFLFYVVLVGAFALPNVRVTHGAPYVSMRVEQVVWGTSPDSPIIVNPGDVNDPLTVVVRNLAEDKTIKGVYAKITLKYPFKSSAGGFEAEAVGQPTEGEILNPTEEVSPAGSFSFTFRIDIDQDAKPGTYYHTMTVYYAVKDVGGKYAEGQPQMLLVKMYLPDRAPVIDSFTPMQTNPSLYVGDQLNFSSRSHDPDGDDLTYTWLVDGNNVSILSFFIYTPNTKDLGTHTVELRVSDGNLTISQTWSVLVDKIKTMEVVVSDNFLIGGSRNLLNITLKNNFWKGVVRVDLATSQPTSAQSLVVYGNRSWIFASIEPNDSIFIRPEIYTPSSSIGVTYTATLTISYNDEYGRSYADTMTIGLAVRGIVRLTVYDVGASPQPVHPESTLTITASLLNKGNVDVSNINASIQSSPILRLSSMSQEYIDNVEKNSRATFSVRATVISGVQNGTYPIILSVTYQDDHSIEQKINATVYVTVINTPENPGTQSGENLLIDVLNGGGWALIILIGVAVVLLILHLRHVRGAEVQLNRKSESAKTQTQK